jgi:hypothetical protein
MPSILGSAQAKWAQQSGSYASGVTQELKLTVSERHLHRRVYVALVPNNGVVTGWAWRGRLEFRLKSVPVETWELGSRNYTPPTTGTSAVPLNVGRPFITPPFWLESFTTDAADWPVTAPVTDQQTSVVTMSDGTNTFLRRVNMLPLQFTGHFDEIAFRFDQAYETQVDGELNYLAFLGCISQPLPD